MRNVLRKEMRLSAHILSYLFIPFGLMFFIPGYPILCGVLFVSLGLFQSFQSTRENNDILFSALLPIAKRDVVKGKFLFVSMVELCSLLLMGASVLARQTLLVNADAYVNNAMMNANAFALGVAFLLFGLFNLLFVDGFFKTAYKSGRPFILYLVALVLVIGVAESLHHIPGLGSFNAFGSEHLLFQLIAMLIGMFAFASLTVVSYRLSCARFEKIDL